MKIVSALLLSILLTGCLTTVPVARNFPEVPEDIKTACPDLKTIDDTTKLSKVIETVTDNYGLYHECRIKIDAWIEWYTTQKKIFEEVN